MVDASGIIGGLGGVGPSAGSSGISGSLLKGFLSKAAGAATKHAPGIFGSIGKSAYGLSTASKGAAWGLGATAGSIGMQAVSKVAGAYAWISMFIFAVIITFLNATVAHGFVSKLSLYIVFFVAYYWVFKDAIDVKSTFRSFLLITVLGVFAPSIGNFIVNFVPIKVLVEFLILILLFVGYGGPLYLMSIVHHEDNKGTKMISFSFVFIMVVFLLMSLGDLIMLDTFDSMTDVVTSQQQEMINSVVSKVVAGIKMIPGKAIEMFGKGTNASKKVLEGGVTYATTGQSYEEQVESKSGEARLGVNLKEAYFGLRDKKYSQGDRVNLNVNVVAESLDIPISLNLGCVADPLKNDIKGELLRESIDVRQYDDKKVSCIFEEDILKEARSYGILFSLDYGFTTSAFLRRCFVAPNPNKKGKYDLSDCGFTSSEAVSTHTNGPIKLGITKNIVVDEVSDYMLFSVEYGISNNYAGTVGNGVIKKINRWTISIPDGFRISKGSTGKYSCTTPVTELDSAECVMGCQGNDVCIKNCETHTVYAVDVSKIPFRCNTDVVASCTGDEGSEYKILSSDYSLSCDVEMLDKNSLLGNSPVAYKNFRSDVSYDYLLYVKDSVAMAKKEGYVSESLDETGHALCGDAKTKYWDTEVETLNAMLKYGAKAVDSVESSVFGSQCPNLMKALVAYNWANGWKGEFDASKNLFGISDAVKTYLSERGASVDTSDSSSGADNVNKFLIGVFKEECLVNGVKDMDCALRKYLGNEYHDRHVIQLYKHFEGSS